LKKRRIVVKTYPSSTLTLKRCFHQNVLANQRWLQSKHFRWNTKFNRLVEVLSLFYKSFYVCLLTHQKKRG
jgi:hypothetical protein